jgi:hypothetical protein
VSSGIEDKEGPALSAAPSVAELRGEFDTLTSNCRPFMSIGVHSRLVVSLEKISLNIIRLPLL